MLILQILISLSQLSSYAATPACHSLNFDSYFIAQNAKSQLMKANDLSKANFDHHYLLLKDEMMMEQLYLIADCDTGKFFHENLSGNANFTLESPRVILSQVKSPETEELLWNGEHFIKVEEKGAKAPLTPTTPLTPASAPSETLSNRYDALFEKYPAEVFAKPCHALDFDSQFQAQKAKSSILKAKPDFSRPNFSGHQLLVKSESMFDVISLLANCEDGKFTHAVLKGSAVFTPTSRLVRVDRSRSFPEFYLLDGEEWVQIPDPLQNRNQKIKNTLSHSTSKLLWEHLSNPQHLSILRFENLKETPELKTVFSVLGTNLIQAGRCSNEKGSPQCEVETQSL